jgi:glycosyltransferase involved in cell wall biosynthesis
MRIAYLSADRGVPVFGTKGASVHVRELTRALHELGHEVLIITAREGGPRPAGFDVPVHEAAAEPYSLLTDFEPDALYERYSLFGTAGAELARELDVPLLLEVNAPLADEAARFRGLVAVDSAQAAERAILRSATRVLAVSGWIAGWALRLGVPERRITILPNGVDPERFRPRAWGRSAVRRELGLGDRQVVGFVGTLKPWHDVGTLVEALALLPSPPALLVVGDGPERERLERESARLGVEAIFTGPVAHERVPAYLAALDVAVAPYAADEGFYFSPLKLVEYLAAARPVVAADLGEISHCVRPGETGLLYEPGSPASLADALRELLADPAEATRLGAAGRTHVVAQHTWQKNARTVAALAGSAREREPVA